MARQVVQLLPASSADRRRALEEVKDFALTDMGYGEDVRWTYKLLREPALTDELCRLAHPSSTVGTHSVTFQPCRSYEQRSQDRHVVDRWDFGGGGTWVFTGVFDGHVNHDTVEYATEKLPSLVRMSLESLLARTTSPSPARISDLLSEAIAEVDSAIMSDFLSTFAQGDLEPPHTHPEFAKTLLSDDRRARHCRIVSRALGGTTALVTLYNQIHGDLWVANVGDCCAVLGTWDGTGWSATLINSIHNCSNIAEVSRVISEHPPHEVCVEDERILGWLAPTRAIGDFWLKLPRMYTEDVFIHFDAMQKESLHKYLPRLQTPPYVSAKADVYHRRIRGRQGEAAPRDVFLITCTDGMLDLAHPEPLQLSQQLIDRWVGVVGRAWQQRGMQPLNLALELLRNSIGGDDTELMSRNLTVEMDERWMDDTTILVQCFS